MQHTTEALKDKELLLATSARIYIPFVELGDASEYYRHDMLHLLGSRGVDALRNVNGLDKDSVVNAGIENIYQEMLDTYKRVNMDDGYVLTMLNYLDWRRNSDNTFVPYRAPQKLIGLTQDPYLADLTNYETEFKTHDICAEVYFGKSKICY